MNRNRKVLQNLQNLCWNKCNCQGWTKPLLMWYQRHLLAATEMMVGFVFQWWLWYEYVAWVSRCFEPSQLQRITSGLLWPDISVNWWSLQREVGSCDRCDSLYRDIGVCWWSLEWVLGSSESGRNPNYCVLGKYFAKHWITECQSTLKNHCRRASKVCKNHRTTDHSFCVENLGRQVHEKHIQLTLFLFCKIGEIIWEYMSRRNALKIQKIGIRNYLMPVKSIYPKKNFKVTCSL